MLDTTNTKERAKPGKMTTWIGRWEKCGEGEACTLNVLREITGASEADIRKAVKELGEGSYDIVTGRTSTKTVAKRVDVVVK